MKKIVLSILFIFGICTVIFSQNISTPQHVSISNDGYNNVSIDTVGAKKALDVNVIAGGAGGGLSQLQVRDALNNWTDVGFFTGDLSIPVSIARSYRPILTNGNQGSLITDLNGNLRTRNLAESVLGDIVSQERSNQVEVLFSSAFDTAITTISTTGTGTATQSNGEAVFATGTGTTSNASAVTVSNILYRPGHEAYFYFSAAWTTPTSANSSQRIGAMDAVFGSANNGFYMGYEGTTMQVSIRQGGVDTHQSFNRDPLDGSANSAFTRNGVVEAIDFTKLNVFRIRWSWFGAAPVVWQVLTPDGSWVTFHHYRNPNTQNIPSIAQPNLFLTLAVDKSSSDATNLKMYTACWAGGTTDDGIKLTDTLTDNTLAKLTRSVIVGHTTAGGGGYVNVKVNPSGALTVDASNSTGLSVSTMPTVTVNQGTTPWSTLNSLSSTITTSQIVVSNSATLIKALNTSRQSIMIRNLGSVGVYIGASGVTTTIGILLNQYDTITLDKNTAAIYGITSSSTSTVSYLEE